jgi:hypothetical protein
VSIPSRREGLLVREEKTVLRISPAEILINPIPVEKTTALKSASVSTTIRTVNFFDDCVGMDLKNFEFYGPSYIIIG